MAVHIFDPKRDGVYDTDANPDVYLTEDQVESAAAKVSCDTEKDKVAKRYVFKIEEAQRNQCLGSISSVDNARLCRELNEKFRSEFGTWIYQSAFARKFYAFFGSGER